MFLEILRIIMQFSKYKSKISLKKYLNFLKKKIIYLIKKSNIPYNKNITSNFFFNKGKKFELF